MIGLFGMTSKTCVINRFDQPYVYVFNLPIRLRQFSFVLPPSCRQFFEKLLAGFMQ
jgi:hypothetical protein